MATTNAIIPTTTLNGIASAIKAKDSGGNMTAAQMADRIAAISTGGWTKPSDWPDLPALLAADAASSNPHGVSATNRVGALVYCTSVTTATVNSPIYVENASTYTGGGIAYSTGGSATFQVGWNWLICYGENFDIVGYGKGIILPSASSICYWIYGDATKSNYVANTFNTLIYNSTNIKNIENVIMSGFYRRWLFATCYGLVSKELKFDCTAKAGTGGILCNGLVGVDKVSGLMAVCSSSGSVSTNTLFSSTYNSPTEIPDYIYLGLSSGNGGFTTLYNLKKLPKVIAPNLLTTSAITYSFANSPFISADSVATFDDEGDINGGFASFPAIPTGEFESCAGTAVEGATSDATGAASTRTFVLHGLVRDKFTDDQQEAIEDAFYDKGWTLSW